MSYSLNSLNGGYIGDNRGTTTGHIKGDTRSLDYSSYPQSLAETTISAVYLPRGNEGSKNVWTLLAVAMYLRRAFVG